MQEQVQQIMLLSAAAVRSRICTSGKSQEKIVERCLCSDRQVRNWTSKDTDVTVSRLYALADSLQSGLQAGGLADPGSGSPEQGIGQE